MVHFTITKSSGYTKQFDISIHATLKEFRIALGDQDLPYNLYYYGNIVIYQKDSNCNTLKQLFETYHPDLLNQAEITFTHIYNFGKPKLRSRKKAISADKSKEETPDQQNSELFDANSESGPIIYLANRRISEKEFTELLEDPGPSSSKEELSSNTKLNI